MNAERYAALKQVGSIYLCNRFTKQALTKVVHSMWFKKKEKKKKGSHPRNNLENVITDYKGADKDSTKNTVNNLDVDRH